MKIRLADKALAYLTLLCGLTISSVAIWYSVTGLVAIFSAAVIPIIVMGTSLEIGKLVATLWLKWNWKRSPVLIKTYLLTSICVLMLITSMGIFGFLSKAHSDQSLVSGDVQAKIAIYDEKIKVAKENIDANRRALKQMDEAVDNLMSRTNDSRGAERSVQLRRTQQKERARLLSEISTYQNEISQLTTERAPIAAYVRKVEAEVGPIKYIAALIYGDNPEANLLERAVRWVIIVIVLVFDPLAIVLLLASQTTFQWIREEKEKGEPIVESKEVPEDKDHGDCPKCGTKLINAPGIGPFCPNRECDVFDNTVGYEADQESAEIIEEPAQEPVDVKPEIVKPKDEDIAAYDNERLVSKFDKESLSNEVEPQQEEIDNDIQAAEKEAMKRWKEENPNDSLKHQRRLYELKIIPKLPWEDYITAKPDYVQNEEQNSSNTIWKKLKEKKNNE